MTPDVSVLVAASRSDHQHHAVARDWLEKAIGATSTGATLTLMPMVLASFLRLVTGSSGSCSRAVSSRCLCPA